MSKILTPEEARKSIVAHGKKNGVYGYTVGIENYEVEQTHNWTYAVYNVIGESRFFVGKFVADQPHRALIQFLKGPDDDQIK